MLVESLGDVATCLIHGRWVHCCCMLVTARCRALWNFETFLDWAKKGKHAAHWGCGVVSVSRAGFRFVGYRRVRLEEALLGVSYARALRAVCCCYFSCEALSPPPPRTPSLLSWWLSTRSQGPLQADRECSYLAQGKVPG